MADAEAEAFGRSGRFATFNRVHPLGCEGDTLSSSCLGWKDWNMDSDIERGRAEAELVRQQQELRRQAAESARHAAERARESAEVARREVSSEVHGTVETLTTLVARMESVEALRREARKREP